MADELLRDLARRAGISVEWQDYTGKTRFVEPAVLHGLLASLGLPTQTGRELSASRKLFNRRNRIADLSPLITGVVGRPTRLDVSGTAPAPAELLLETGEIRPLTLIPARGRLRVPPIHEAGYHRLALDNRQIVLAIAPPRCWTAEDAVPDARLWGLVAAPTTHLGDAMAIIRTAAPAGADALGFCPSGTGADSSGSRLFADPSMAGSELVLGRPAPDASSDQALQTLFDQFLDGPDWDGPLGADFARYRHEASPALQRHARFLVIRETLGLPAGSSWQSWPNDLRTPDTPAVAALARTYADRILFHEFAQWLLDRSKAAVQRAARQAGMRIGLLGDLHLGAPTNGSETWSRQDSMILNASTGAPPNAEAPEGQRFDLTAFSPRALEASGYAAFIAALRAAMRHSGGVHIGHASGLARQWLVPSGASPEQGAYVSYPTTDLLRLIALESTRHQSIVTAAIGRSPPPGLVEALEQAAIGISRVLLEDHPATWTADVVGLTSRPNGPSVRAWWSAADSTPAAALWERIGASAPLPARDGPARVVDAAIQSAGESAAPLVLVPLHDLAEAGASLDHPDAERRLETLARLRPRY
ncbi:MAG TPA: 4-alpha-glucanotransferase [Rhodopila sp.]|uniref:4-alpha-glucanotransferase n=1 Tax=Rhodopila sp. TaxID=2480087 RepID=UPI002BEB8401|nr:4-alpha-glucanotransferase [Rhodopila sp.]HVY16304.1 4-alpha-glucanotransferase [Rhodopila sp.]